MKSGCKIMKCDGYMNDHSKNLLFMEFKKKKSSFKTNNHTEFLNVACLKLKENPIWIQLPNMKYDPQFFLNLYNVTKELKYYYSRMKVSRKDQVTANKSTREKSKEGKEDKKYSLTLSIPQSLQEQVKPTGSYEQLNVSGMHTVVLSTLPLILLKFNTIHGNGAIGHC